MKKRFITLALAPLLLMGALAHAQDHNDKETKEDIARHRAMAVEDDVAAYCVESGMVLDVCHFELLTGCKGLGFGTNCGMRHSH